jgi:hypothetical protein
MSNPRSFAARIERTRRTLQARQDGRQTPGFGVVTFVTLGAALAGMAAMSLLEEAEASISMLK